MRIDRERVFRTLTFWLRPDFVLRCLRRFQALEGFDRGVALASLTFTALIPLGIVMSGVIYEHDAAAQLVDRYGLEGKGATAVRDLFGSSDDVASGFSVFSAFLLLVTILSFSRALQRLFERAWELEPLSLRNTKNGLVWVIGLLVYSAVAGFVRSAYDDGVMELLTTAVLLGLGLAFVVFTGVSLSNRRLTRHQLMPIAALVVALGAMFAIGGDIYVPRLFNSYAERYGAVGAVFAIISWLFVLMVALVAAVAVGREVWAELEAIRRGDRPSHAQVEAEWAAVRSRAADWRARRKEFREP